MSHSLPLSVLLTVLFAVTAVGYLGFAFRPGSSGVARVSDVFHVLMSVAMLAMPWAWGMTLAPPTLQILVFGLATSFYLVLTLGSSRYGSHEHHGPGGSGRLVLGYHVVMMAAMTLMGVMMLPMAGGASMSMPEMDMTGSGHSMHTSWSGWTPVSWVLVVVFAIATVWMLVRLIASARVRQHPLARLDGVLLLLMSAGMALASIPTS
ncbi:MULTISPECIES: DUF5134 domain-containing protein [Curtobacterium]|uniref:DUF5134 domain-containing protein n=1 Tax=Curtobacterium TaxID=2034 RepID=UPI0007011574|nr:MULTISPECIES: DUF5134 domain-containing protein [Curtobacterium]KQR32720.1 hypothetical protein ASF75_05030 [Curtobacterium sp. Leaf154]MBT1596808.1 DUF5134 domain-containing protein [Curtobacterium flaccumfaciens pv. flaccumfaciens]MCS6564293.1 DUF5134 domain-containing protein [Curtobacterium flaccumfaciens pv. flaccumfaciens]MCS6577867.1 DUF5134 domain-containing protein [Curtobacterium flaccumfaciens]MCU0115538.1 DUF5134 domain-containing protein [Curtobacterium flaccumfaciens]